MNLLWRVGLVVAVGSWLVGCASSEVARQPGIVPSPPSIVGSSLYAEIPGPGLECVPYARDHSGIGIFGDAHQWWDIAEGYFMRSSEPVPGAVLVLARTDRLRYGHLAVVARVLGKREILVDHANWIPGRIVTGMPVVDVSRANDWTLLRFWNREAGTFGTVYPAEGFIYNPATIAETILTAPKSVTLPAG